MLVRDSWNHSFVAVEIDKDDNISELLGVELDDGTYVNAKEIPLITDPDNPEHDGPVVRYEYNGRTNLLVWMGGIGVNGCKNVTIVGGYRDEGDIFEDRELYLDAWGGPLCDFDKPVVSQMAADPTKGAEWLQEQIIDRVFKRETLTLRYRSANLQWSVDRIAPNGTITEAPVELCEEVTYEVSLKSTRLGNIYVSLR